MSKFNLRGKMTVTVHGARGLSNKELLGKMDPFTEVTISGSKDERFKTKVAKDMHQNPKWEQSYIFNLEGKEEIFHANVYNEATLGNDHIGRLDLSLDQLDMSGKPAWYGIKDKQNFTKQTGELQMSVVFDGSGLPAGSHAFNTNAKRFDSASPKAGGPASPMAAAGPVVYGSVPAQQPQQSPQPQQQQQQQYQSQQPNYQQPPPQQQYQSQPPQQQPYQSQPPPVYAPPQQPMYQPAPQPVYQSQAPVYQQPAPVVYQTQAPVYQQQPAVVYQQPPTVTFQPAAPVYVQQQQPAPVVYTQVQGGYPGVQQQRQGQLIGYWPNGQPRYA